MLVGGYVSTAVLSSAIGAAAAPWQAGVFRAAAWTACGLRVPARNALLAEVVPAQVYGRAYGFEQAMDNLGAIGGPLLAIGLLATDCTRFRRPRRASARYGAGACSPTGRIVHPCAQSADQNRFAQCWQR